MTTQDAIKFCFTTERYNDLMKGAMPPAFMLQMASLVAFWRNWDGWPETSQHYAVAQKLRKDLLHFEETLTVEE